jgi:ArsR family transcriptional regulator
MTEEEMIEVFKALSVDSRLQILKLIRHGELCVNAITQRLDITQPAVSQHLSVLKQAGLVRSDRYGSIVHYSIDAKRLEDFKKSVRKYLGDEFILLEE